MSKKPNKTATRATPKAASRRLAPIPADPDTEGSGLGLAALIEQETEELHALARRADVHTAALAVDPHHWQLMRFVLWKDTVAPDEPATERLEYQRAVTGTDFEHPLRTEKDLGSGFMRFTFVFHFSMSPVRAANGTDACAAEDF